MLKFSKIIAIFLIVLLFSCSSSHSTNDTDILPDADADTQDSETQDDDSDSQETEIVDDYDEQPDIDLDKNEDETLEEDDSEEEWEDEDYGPLPDNCIEIYPGQANSRLCLGPKKTDVKCNANPKENEYVSALELTNPIGDSEGRMDINEDFIFFTLNPHNSKQCFKGETYCPNIYGCNREDEYVYEIISSKFIHHFFAVDGNKIVFNVWDGTSSDFNYSKSKIFIADLNTIQISEITGNWGSYSQMQIKFPYIAFSDTSDQPIIFNLEINSSKKIPNLKCWAYPKIDGKNLSCLGRYVGEGLSKDELNDVAWLVNMETFAVSPLSILTYSGESPVVSTDYVMIGSGRDLVYYSNAPGELSGMEIYSFNLKTKREEKWTPEIKGIFEGNFIAASFEYPYFSYLANETDHTSTGVCYALNIETEELIEFWEITSDKPYIKDRYILEEGYFPDKLAKLPDLPKLPENADELCEDNNPCTDNRYFVTDGECHFIPNHERCDDGDDTTLFDICIDGECRGFSGTSTDEEMVTVEAGKFRYAGREYEIEKPFKMDVFEVTNGKYAECVAAKACVKPLRKRSLTVLYYYGNPFYENYPVLYVNQFEAQNYCNWLGKRLPTEFEWMKATWDGEEKTYLWGEEKPDSSTYPDSYYANVGFGYPQMTGWDVVEVGTFPKDKTIGGIMDMSGNVSEWTTSEWTAELCETPPCHGKFGSDLIVSKGGGDWSGAELATRYPWTPWTHSFRVGFRCVKDIDETEDEIKP